MISLNRLAGQVECISSLLKRRVVPEHLSVLKVRNRSFKSTSNEVEEEIDPNKPIKYSTSDAAKWAAANARRSPNEDRPRFERTIVGGSLAIFMLYFFIFREENDLDELITIPLPEQLAKLEAERKAKHKNL